MLSADAKTDLLSSAATTIEAESPGRTANPQKLSNAAVPKTNNSANVGHPNKSKVMHDLFGIEKTEEGDNSSTIATSSSTDLMASTSR